MMKYIISLIIIIEICLGQINKTTSILVVDSEETIYFQNGKYVFPKSGFKIFLPSKPEYKQVDNYLTFAQAFNCMEMIGDCPLNYSVIFGFAANKKLSPDMSRKDLEYTVKHMMDGIPGVKNVKIISSSFLKLKNIYNSFEYEIIYEKKSSYGYYYKEVRKGILIDYYGRMLKIGIMSSSRCQEIISNKYIELLKSFELI